MRTLTLVVGLLFALNLFAAEDIYKTSKELRRKEDKAEGIKEVPSIPVVESAKPKVITEVNCTNEAGETLTKTDDRFEQCLVTRKKPTKVKGK